MKRTFGYLLILLFCVGFLASGEAESEDSPVAGSPREDASRTSDGIQSQWLPRAGLGFVLNLEKFQVDAQSNTPASTPLGGDGPYSRAFSTSGEEKRVGVGLFDLALGVSTPVLINGSWAPRLYLGADVMVALSDEFSILQERKSYRASPSFGPLYPATYEDTWTHCGYSRGDPLSPQPQTDNCDQNLSMKYSIDLAWSLQAGLELTLPVASRQFKIVPTVRYFGQRLEFQGRASREDRAVGSGIIVARYQIPDPVQRITLHSLGFAINGEVSVGKRGPVEMVFFVSPSFSWLLNADDGVRITSSGEDGSAAYTVSTDPMIIQIASGIRLVWTGR